MQQRQRTQWSGRPKGLIILFWSTALKWIDKDRDDDEFRALLKQYCADSVAGQIISLGKQYRPIQLLEYQTDVRRCRFDINLAHCSDRT